MGQGQAARALAVGVMRVMRVLRVISSSARATVSSITIEMTVRELRLKPTLETLLTPQYPSAPYCLVIAFFEHEPSFIMGRRHWDAVPTVLHLGIID
jgi:hypothetical protein